MVRINFQFKGLHYHILFMAAKLANKSDLLEPFCTYHITVFENIPKRSHFKEAQNSNSYFIVQYFCANETVSVDFSTL